MSYQYQKCTTETIKRPIAFFDLQISDNKCITEVVQAQVGPLNKGKKFYSLLPLFVMSAFVYILHSEKLDRFYTGSTELPPIERLNLHLLKRYGTQKFTAKADDWTLYLSFECNDLVLARKIERFIKRQKSRKYIELLYQQQERIKWLIENC